MVRTSTTPAVPWELASPNSPASTSNTITTKAGITPAQICPPQTLSPPLTPRPWQRPRLVRPTFLYQPRALVFICSLLKSVHDGECRLVAAAPGIISASPYGGAHAFPPAFAIQQTAGQQTSDTLASSWLFHFPVQHFCRAWLQYNW